MILDVCSNYIDWRDLGHFDLHLHYYHPLPPSKKDFYNRHPMTRKPSAIPDAIPATVYRKRRQRTANCEQRWRLFRRAPLMSWALMPSWPQDFWAFRVDVAVIVFIFIYCFFGGMSIFITHGFRAFVGHVWFGISETFGTLWNLSCSWPFWRRKGYCLDCGVFDFCWLLCFDGLRSFRDISLPKQSMQGFWICFGCGW